MHVHNICSYVFYFVEKYEEMEMLVSVLYLNKKKINISFNVETDEIYDISHFLYNAYII